MFWMMFDATIYLIMGFLAIRHELTHPGVIISIGILYAILIGFTEGKENLKKDLIQKNGGSL